MAEKEGSESEFGIGRKIHRSNKVGGSQRKDFS